MQYRISTLVALLSATTALAYLDCGGGRAPPKTTVPGCPGYIDPATAVPSSTDAEVYEYVTVTAPTSTRTNVATVYRTLTSDASHETVTSVYSDQPESAIAVDKYFTAYTDPDAVVGCNCRGYLCQYATPGCVNLDASSTITANPGWETKSFDSSAYYEYIMTASSAGGELSVDGLRIELITTVPSDFSYTKSASKTAASSATVTASVTESGSVTAAATTTLATSTRSASSSGDSSSEANASSTGVVAANTNSGSKLNGMASVAALLVTGAAAIVLL